MSQKKQQSGLGRGLDALFISSLKKENDKEDKENQEEIILISIETLKAGIHQPRKLFTEESLEELASSIKNQGIIQPLLVRKITNETPYQYEIIAGERRYRAAQKAALKEIPVIVRDYTDAETMTIALIENLQREDLNAIEEAEAYFKLKEVHKLSQEELAQKLGKSRSGVANALRLLSLPEHIKESIINNEIKSSHGRSLLAISDEKAQEILFQAIKTKDLNSREIEKAVEYWKDNNTFPVFLLEETNTISELEENTLNKNTSTIDRKSLIKTDLSEFLHTIDQKLKDKFYKKAHIRGDERKGSIKISYKTPEELQYILDTLNIECKVDK